MFFPFTRGNDCFLSLNSTISIKSNLNSFLKTENISNTSASNFTVDAFVS